MPAKLKIKVLTATHIAKGDSIGSFEYHCHNGIYYRINTSKALDFIIREHPDAINKIDSWVDVKTEKLETVNKAKSFYKLSLFDFVKSLHNNQLNIKFNNIDNIKSISNYSMIANNNPSGRDVSELLKTASNEVYIPGSSLKGMIRNAILNYYIANSDDTTKAKIISLVKDSVEQPFNDWNKKHFADKIQYLVFNCSLANDAKYDMMKFITVSDSNTLAPATSCKLIQPEMVTRAGKKQTQANFLECIKEGTEFESRLVIDIKYMKLIASKYPDIYDNKKPIWVGFDKKVKLTFGVTIEDLRNLSDIDIEYMISDHIYSSIYAFAKNVSRAEFNIRDAKKSEVKIDNYERNIENIMLESNSAPFKLGWGSGFPAITIFTNFLEDGSLDTPQNRKLFVEIMKKYAIGKAPGFRNDSKPFHPKIENFPTSRKYEINGEQASALGWMELTME